MLNCLIGNQVLMASKVKEWLGGRKQKETNELLKFQQALEETEERRKLLVKKTAALYQDWKEGILDQDEYFYMKKRYEEELEGCEADSRELTDKKHKYIMACTSENPALKAVSEIPEDFLLTKELVDRLMERIEIYEGHRVKVSFTFQDELQRSCYCSHHD